MKKLLENEEGQVIPLFALLLVVLLGFSALAIDVGMVALTKSRMQNAADAAALAAAKNLPDSSTAITTALTYAGKNGLKATANGVFKEGDTVTATTPYESKTNVIRVECTRNVSYTFARALGFTDIDVSAEAIAVGNKIWAGEALPFVNLDDNYNIGDQIVLWEATGPGDFESIFWKDYTIYYEDIPEKTYFTVNISDGGITLDKGVDASKKTAIENICYYQTGKPIYFWSLRKEVITSGKYCSPKIDPHTVVPLSELMLL
jgi:hypothetical protein